MMVVTLDVGWSVPATSGALLVPRWDTRHFVTKVNTSSEDIYYTSPLINHNHKSHQLS
jgi:hypothetical protein